MFPIVSVVIEQVALQSLRKTFTKGGTAASGGTEEVYTHSDSGKGFILSSSWLMGRSLENEDEAIGDEDDSTCT